MEPWSSTQLGVSTAEARTPGHHLPVLPEIELYEREPEAGTRRLRRMAAMVAALTAIPLVALVVPNEVQRMASSGQEAVEIETVAPTTEQADEQIDEQPGSQEAEQPELIAAPMRVASAEGSGSTDLDPFSADGGLGEDGGAAVAPPTTRATTTTASVWTEPQVEDAEEWVDGGNGVALPDLLLRIRFCESTNNYQARHTVSSASGAYQFVTKSWVWYGHAKAFGVGSAAEASPGDQDRAALATWRQDGARPWAASRKCWGGDSMDPRYLTAKQRNTTTSTEAQTADDSSTTSEASTDGSSSTTTSTESATGTTAKDESTTTSSSTTSTTAEATTSTAKPQTSDETTDTSAGS